MSEPPGYSKTQIALHWVSVGLVALQLVLHNGMANAWDRAQATGVFSLSMPVVVHFVIGGCILGLTMWRFAVRQEQGVPPPPAAEPEVLKRAGHAAHLGFYVVLILLPVTGGLAWGMESDALSKVHEILRLILVALIFAHIGAVIFHQKVLRSGLLQRMTRTQD
ncbi:cytochrome b [Tropicimonas sp. S265A]|uniref:cytochrome b n=1 Tax=Tropicimonas sp. S265A TaxID=3415134 RepID=UPI003C797FC8